MPSSKKQKKDYKDLTVYIYTCDKTWFILKAFIYLFEKYWGEWRNVVVLGFKKPDFELPKHYKFVSLGKDEGPDAWTTPIYNYFKKSKDEYFMFTIDDFLPIGKKNEKILKDLYDHMLHDPNIVKAGLGFYPSHHPHEIEIIEKKKDYDVFEVRQDAPYRLSTQMGIWKKDYFLKYYKKPRNPWQVEIDASEEAKNDGARIIGTKRRHAFRWIERTALSSAWKGKINVLGLTEKDLRPLIEGGILDPEKVQYGQHISPPFAEYGYNFKITDLREYFSEEYYQDLVLEYGEFYEEKVEASEGNYDIEGTKNINTHPSYLDSSLAPDFQKKLVEFKKLVKGLVDKKKSATFFKFGDGEYHFLKKNPYGTATPGYVTLINKNYDNLDLGPFHEGVLKCDYLSCEIYPENRRMFKELWPNRIWDFPAEFHYGLTYNRWFTKTFKGKVGLIGAKEKLDVIKELVKFKKYRDYLGLGEEGFIDYIEFPQRGSSDDIEKTEKLLARQLKKAKSDIFLLGMGQAKMALLHRLPKYKKAVYMDVGAGIDGLAGMCDDRRPYAGDWINFRLEGYDYSGVHEGYTRYEGQGKHVFLRTKKDFLWYLDELDGEISRPFNALNIYNDLLAKYQNLPPKILLVGTAEDKFVGDIKTYLPEAQVTFLSDGNMDKNALINFANKMAPYDLVIDYGNANVNRQVNTFIALFPLINVTGTYVLENIYGSYWPEFGGQLYSQHTAVEAMKTMIDRLNWPAYRNEKAGETQVKTPELDFFEQTLTSLHFYNNLIIIEKGINKHAKVYKNGVIEDY